MNMKHAFAILLALSFLTLRTVAEDYWYSIAYEGGGGVGSYDGGGGVGILRPFKPANSPRASSGSIS